MPKFTLVSHTLCPYVQRAAIALDEKHVPFTRRDVDLSAKPDWFKAISPLGKVPLLQVSDEDKDAVIFESAVILEYLEETQPKALHPADPLDRARHRSWIEFGSAQLNTIARLYNSAGRAVFDAECENLRQAFARLETELSERRAGPFFAGVAFSLVDAVYAPIFRYFDAFEMHFGLRLLDGLPSVAPWRMALAERESVRRAVVPDFADRLAAFLLARKSFLSTLAVTNVSTDTATQAA